MILRLIAAALLIAAGPAIAVGAKPGAKTAARSAPRPVQPADWTRLVRVTADGHFVRGNPAAKVKLIEYASFTCPHCAAFAAESVGPLEALIRSGQVSLEFRPALRDMLDLGAAITVRCAGPTRYFGMMQAVFADQNGWIERGVAHLQAQGDDKRPAPVRVRAAADAAGFTALARKQGLSAAQLNACFADARRNQQLVTQAQAHWKRITGTPSFFIGDEKLEAGDWATLEPILQARLAR